ncbi:MBL fold metallo-hydrolase [Clostridium fungisolvens]|uniref:Metallo-beta-lactamase domain-containing protein n=1 Tax=Clostridium fungisolvens TaxID=1604897 RepID=A0A6V8SI60_9CLOT|nr:MBL fold metallo-hydrolase [Clostridium fungisolvens]GFP76272.1 hypothetical protein bsdtw1_02373 [Clostridium fungisolvens]
MKISILIENTKNNTKDLICERGLSIYIETNGKRILFDTGKSGNFISNANNMGIDLKHIDAAILSHGHHDHGGGLLSFLQINNKSRVYAKRAVDRDFYFRTMLFSSSIGINKKMFNEYLDRINYIDEFTEIIDNVYIITDIEKRHKIPKGNKYLFVKDGDRLINDKFEHELIMVIREKDDLTIFTGCSHNGTVNMIDAVRNRFPDLKIKAIVGGFHLVRFPLVNSLTPSEEEINLLLKKIQEEDIKEVYTGHCTGEKAFKKLESALCSNVTYIRTGMEFNI